MNKMHGGGAKGGSGSESIKDPSPAKRQERKVEKQTQAVPRLKGWLLPTKLQELE